MKQSLTKFILAIITQDPGLVAGGGAPVYIASDRTEQDRIAL